MKQILRAIHVGVGRRGEWPLRLANAAAGFQPVALVDSDAPMLASARQICGDVPAFTSIAEAAANVKADVAIICTPTRFHLEHASACFAAGLHVLTEKGLAQNLRDALAIVERAHSAQRALCVAQNYRYQAMERTVARMLRDPSHPQFAGAPYLIEYTQNRQRPHPRTMDYPFASVWDMSCHHFDNLLFWLGPGFTRLTAEAFGPSWSRYRYPNNTSIQATHASGCFVHYLHAHNAAVNEIRIRIQSEHGAILVDEDRVSFCPRGDVQLQHETPVPVPREEHLGEAGVLADFHRHCVSGEPVGISGEANLIVMALCDATCRSVDAGAAVQVG